MPQDTALSTIFKAVGTGLGAASEQNQVDKKTQKQDALKMFMLMQEQEQMKMAQAKHNQAMLAGALNMKKADQDIKKNNIELNYLANPDLKFQEDLKKQNELKKQFILENLDPNLQGLDILKGVGINSSDDINISPLDMGTLGLDALNRVKDSLPKGSALDTPFGSAVGDKQYKPDNSKNADELYIEYFGPEAWRKYKDKGITPTKTLSAEDGIIYNYYKKTFGDEVGIKKYVEFKTQSKTNTPEGAALRLIMSLTAGGRKASYRLDDPEQKEELFKVVGELVQSIYGADVNVGDLIDTSGTGNGE